MPPDRSEGSAPAEYPDLWARFVTSRSWTGHKLIEASSSTP